MPERETGRVVAGLVRIAPYFALIFLYWPTFAFAPLGLDDESQLRALAGAPSSVLWARDHFGHFRPLKTLVFWLLARGAVDVAVVRVVALGLTLLSLAAVRRWAARISGSAPVGDVTALLWGVHPLTVTATAWLSAMNSVPCLLGVLVYLEAGDRAARANEEGRSARTPIAIGIVGLTIAAMSHEVALVAPLVLRASQRLCGVRGSARALYLGALVLALAMLASVVTLSGATPAYRFRAVSPWQMSLSAARYLFVHLSMFVWPFGRFGVLLSDQPERHLAVSVVCWVALVALGALVMRYRKQLPAATVGLVFALAFLAPFSNFVPLGNTPIAFHYLFLPGVGLALACSAAGAAVQARVGAGRAQKALIFAVVGGIAIAWAIETREVVASFGSTEALYRVTTHNHPDEVEPLANLADIYLADGRYEEARAVLDVAEQHAPNDPIVLQNRFELSARTDKRSALGLLDQHPGMFGDVEAAIRRGELLLGLGQYGEARAALEGAFERADKPSEARLRAGYQLVIALIQTDDLTAAGALVARLLAEYPGQRELLLAAELLREEEAARGR